MHSINFNAKVKPLKPINDEFTLVKVYVQAIGKNRNWSYMSKENIEKFVGTLSYCPVVGHIREYTDENGTIHRYMGGHDHTFNDEWEWVSLTVPYGVVVDNSYDFEIVEEYGKEVEYLTANAILWTGRYPELGEAIYSEDFWFNQSMEISVGQYRQLEEDSNYTELLEWQYSALCLLGKADEYSTNGHVDESEHTEPCFINSKVLPVDFTVDEFASLMDEMKDKIAFCFNSNDEAECVAEETESDSSVEEVEITVEEKEEVIETDEPDGEAEEVVESENDEIEAKIIDSVVSEEKVDYEQLYAELLVEYDKIKISYDELDKEFSEYKAEHSFLNADYDALAAFKAEQEKKDREAEEAAVFAEFAEKIGKTEEFAQLKKDASNYSIADIKSKLFGIVGMYSMEESKTKRELSRENLSAGSNTDEEEEPYGGILKFYLNR